MSPPKCIIPTQIDRTSFGWKVTLNMTSSFMSHVAWSLGGHENNYLNTFLSNSTKYDIVVILVFFSELFDEYPIRGSMRKVFFRFLVGTACRQYRRRNPDSGFAVQGSRSAISSFYKWCRFLLFYSKFLENICFADYIDRITFQNQIWLFNEMTSLIKTFYRLSFWGIYWCLIFRL